MSITFNGEPSNPSIGSALTNSSFELPNTPISHHQPDSSFPDLFFNDDGLIRQNLVRDYILADLDSLPKPDYHIIIDGFVYWSATNEYLVMKQETLLKGLLIAEVVFAVLGSKRGNDVYIARIEKRLEGLHGIKTLFGLGKIHALWVDLTCDPSFFGYSITKAWNCLSPNWNRIHSWFRKLFGIDYIGFFRVYEAFNDPSGKAYGYPHIHVLLFFSKKPFIHNKKVSAKWHAFTKTRLVRNLGGAINYLIKYLLKGFTDSRFVLTPAMLWLFRKRTFGISRNLINLIQVSMHNSNLIQMTLNGKVAFTTEIYQIGIFSEVELQRQIDIQSKSGLKIRGKWYLKLDFTPEKVPMDRLYAPEL